jgi:hypothetical protein
MKTLDWKDLRILGKSDKANRWYPSAAVEEYFTSYRSPSRAYPHSYARAAMTQKFARWLKWNRPELAKKLGIEELAQ